MDANVYGPIRLVQPVAPFGIRIRAARSDEEWVAMGAVDDDEYYARFSRLLGVDIAPND